MLAQKLLARLKELEPLQLVAALLKAADDRADEAALHAVRLDHDVRRRARHQGAAARLTEIGAALVRREPTAWKAEASAVMPARSESVVDRMLDCRGVLSDALARGVAAGSCGRPDAPPLSSQPEDRGASPLHSTSSTSANEEVRGACGGCVHDVHRISHDVFQVIWFLYCTALYQVAIRLYSSAGRASD